MSTLFLNFCDEYLSFSPDLFWWIILFERSYWNLFAAIILNRFLGLKLCLRYLVFTTLFFDGLNNSRYSFIMVRFTCLYVCIFCNIDTANWQWWQSPTRSNFKITSTHVTISQKWIRTGVERFYLFNEMRITCVEALLFVPYRNILHAADTNVDSFKNVCTCRSKINLRHVGSLWTFSHRSNLQYIP